MARPPANEQPRRFNQNATRYGFGTDAGRPPAAPPRPNPPSTIPNRQYPSAGYHPREGGGWINPAEQYRQANAGRLQAQAQAPRQPAGGFMPPQGVQDRFAPPQPAPLPFGPPPGPPQLGSGFNFDRAPAPNPQSAIGNPQSVIGPPRTPPVAGGITQPAQSVVDYSGLPDRDLSGRPAAELAPPPGLPPPVAGLFGPERQRAEQAEQDRRRRLGAQGQSRWDLHGRMR